MTHEEPTVDEVVQFALVSARMERVRAYAQRGRQYAHLTAEELHAPHILLEHLTAYLPPFVLAQGVESRRDSFANDHALADYGMIRRGLSPQ